MLGPVPNPASIVSAPLGDGSAIAAHPAFFTMYMPHAGHGFPMRCSSLKFSGMSGAVVLFRSVHLCGACAGCLQRVQMPPPQAQRPRTTAVVPPSE